MKHKPKTDYAGLPEKTPFIMWVLEPESAEFNRVIIYSKL
jgi:hypothetical protein